MDHNSSLFIAKLNEIKDLYAEVKEVIVLAENFDPSSDVYLSPLTELRNTLDHIMRSFIYPDRLDSEFDEAKEHLYRAGYDAYEVLAINVSNRIVKCIEKYNTQTIATIFPTYYTEVKQSIINIQIEVAEERAHKRLDPETGTKSFTPYKEKITTLLNHLKTCEYNIPHLQKEKTKGRLKSIGSIVLGILIAVAGMYIYDNFLKKESKKPQLEEHDKNANPK